FHRYADAESAVDYLLDHEVPGERVEIVASDLRFVEAVTGRLGYAAAAADGAAGGAVIGALFGFVAGVFNWVEPIGAGLMLGLYGLVLGAILGAAVGAVLHRFTRRGFASVGRLDAGRYDVMVDEGHATRVVELLERRSTDRSHEARSSDAESPPSEGA
ncbi:MAG TPA: general stress protein, partial [Thermoleophilaceae bacterium]|nr:general stress protein [Thermoleophilaceae bacterium]